MKRSGVSCLILIAIFLFSNNLKANPIGAKFFSELVFDSTGWKLEMNLTMGTAEGDSLSLKGWYLVCGSDTAYFKDWQYLKAPARNGSGITNTNYLVLTKDSLKGSLNLDIKGGILILYSPDGYDRDNFLYGNPSLKPGQSICKRYDNSWYLDNSPTIGAPNDLKDATATMKVFVKDAAGKPVINERFSYAGSHTEFYSTDSTGHFSFENWPASDYSFYFSNGVKYKYLTVSLQPGDVKEVEFQLDWLTDVPQKPSVIIKEYSLAQNYPNPFNPVTSISYSVAKAGPVKLQVFNLLGNNVATLVNEYKNAGTHKVSFDASMLPSGVYIYTIHSGQFRSAKKMTVMK